MDTLTRWVATRLLALITSLADGNKLCEKCQIQLGFGGIKKCYIWISNWHSFPSRCPAVESVDSSQKKSFMDVEVWFSLPLLLLPLLLPTPVQYTPLVPSPLYIHYRPDYANMGSFMSSVLRIFSSPRVCKEARYHHWPIVAHSLQSAANPHARAAPSWPKCRTIVSHSSRSSPRKAPGREMRWNTTWDYSHNIPTR